MARREAKPDRHLLPRFRKPVPIVVVVIEETLTVMIATAGGDELKLRGIPVVGGAAGAIRGTVPHAVRDVV